MDTELPAAAVSVFQEPGDQLQPRELLQRLDLQERAQHVRTCSLSSAIKKQTHPYFYCIFVFREKFSEYFTLYIHSVSSLLLATLD